MAKISRNAPCPCGSGKKYKKCCLDKDQAASRHKDQIPGSAGYFMHEIDELDNLSNQVLDLIDAGRLDHAEKSCQKLLTRYPDQIDGFERMAQLLEAKGENKKAAGYYRKASTFAKTNPGFDPESVQWYVEQAERLESEN